MSGGLMQLVAYGSQNAYLNGNPQMTHFKMVYHRHTNFSMEYINVEFLTKPILSSTQQTNFQIKMDRYGDLLHDTYIVWDAPSLYTTANEPVAWVEQLGNALIDMVELSIDGQLIDRTYGRWMAIWNELTLSDARKHAYKPLIGDDPQMRAPYLYSQTTANIVIPPRRIYCPLNFWFCVNPGLALPLVALQYAVVYMRVYFNPLNTLFVVGNPAVSPNYLFSIPTDAPPTQDGNRQLAQRLRDAGYDASSIFSRYAPNYQDNIFAVANYIFLDEDERKRFAQRSTEYLIPTTTLRSFIGLTPGPQMLDIKTLANPVKTLIWTMQRYDMSDTNDWLNFTCQKQYSDYAYVLDMMMRRNITFQRDPEYTTLLTDPTVLNYFQSWSQTYLTGPYQTAALINGSLPNGVDILQEAGLLFYGNERNRPEEHNFLSRLQQYKYYTGSSNKPGIYSYSFSLQPTSDIPTGTCNFSLINNAYMKLQVAASLEPGIKYNMYLYAVGFNIVRFVGGFASIVWAN